MKDFWEYISQQQENSFRLLNKNFAIALPMDIDSMLYYNGELRFERPRESIKPRCALWT